MNAWLRRGFIATLLGVASLAYAPVAHAQIAAAIGKPLPSSDLPAGTLSVRVIAGKVSDPVVGTDVTLVVNGTPRQARTDAGGRASFTNLPSGATVQAKVVDEDKKDVTSEEFQLSTESGERLLLSTKPFQAPVGGAPFAGGGGGMPQPRQISGEPRPEVNDQPGTYTVRLTYDDLADKAPPKDVAVYLVGYRADDKVVVYQQKSDAAGRATFGDLDRTGATSYFAMTELPRGGVGASPASPGGAAPPNGGAVVIDRLVSTPAVLDSRGGVRLILSGDKRDSTAPAIDDLNRIEKQELAPEAGKIRVLLMGVPDDAGQVSLVAMNPAGVRRVIDTKPQVRSVPNPKDIQGETGFAPKDDIPAHGLRVQVHGGSNANEPLGGSLVRIAPASDPTKIVQQQTVPEGGIVDLEEATAAPLVAIVTINGKDITSQPFDITKKGGFLDVEAHWDAQGKLYADFDSASIKPDEVAFAETTMRKQVYRSVPFQPVAAHGTKATLYVYPRIMFSFEWSSRIDDEFLAVGGKFELRNNSWAPYVGSSDGLIVPLPAHFKGARVGEQDQDDVAVAQGEGFRIGRPIPPGGKEFHGQFSMPIEHGNVEWSLDLPLGAFQSGMEILQTPGMSVQTPGSVRGQVVTVPQGTFYVLSQISILPHQSMQMTITNLPSQPAWKTWAPRLVGLFGLLTMLGGLGLALYRTSTSRAAQSDRAAKKNELLDELVELEKSGKNEKRRAQIASELERLWAD